MDVIEAIKTRRSVRRFLDRPVDEEKLTALFEAVRMAPSWANLQCWRFVVVKDRSTREEISELSYVESFFASVGYKANPAKKGLAEAPVIVLACADPSQSGMIWDQYYYLTDVGIAAQTLMLAAHALGMATVFVGVFDEDRIRRLLNIPSNIRVVGLFPIGYTQEQRKEGPGRKPLHEIIFHERWSE